MSSKERPDSELTPAELSAKYANDVDGLDAPRHSGVRKPSHYAEARGLREFTLQEEQDALARVQRGRENGHKGNER